MRDSDLVKSVATFLAAGTGWAWEPHVSGQVAIWYGQIGDGFDRACGITLYDPGVNDPGADVGGPRRLQLRFRGAPGDRDSADDLAQDAFDVLNGAMRIGGIHLIRRLPNSSAQLGIDGSGRRERADNYSIQPDLET